MNNTNGTQRQAIIDQLIEHIKQHTPAQQAILLETFARRYFTSCATEDLKSHSVNDLFAILLSNWNLIYQRQPGEVKIRIFNPEKEKEGWHSTHTVIEISHDDFPFLVDSTRMEISRHNYQIHFIIHIGGFKVKRDNQFRIIDIPPAGITDPQLAPEAPIYIEIDRIADAGAREALRADIEKVLGDVRVAVVDWRKMSQRAEECLEELEKTPPPLDSADIAESRDFLRWLINNNFTFLGCRDYKLIGNGTNRALQTITGSGLGVLREDNPGKISKTYAELPPQARKMALSKNILIIAKTNTRSTVHRATYTDYIGVKRFNASGELIGERRFIGLYTSSAYHSSPRQIPFLRHKVAKVIQELHFPPDSHDGKEVVHILETLPRDDLLQASNEELSDLTLSILHLQERKYIRLFVRRDAYYRYFSCLVYVPRETFNTELAIAFQDVLIGAFKGIECSFTTYFSDSILARIHYLIRVNPKIVLEYDVDQLEQTLTVVARSWSDDLKDQLIEAMNEAEGLKLYSKYSKAFPASYTECYSSLEAIRDIKKIEILANNNPLEMLFDKSIDEDKTKLRLKLFHPEETIVLSDVLPTLENMGLRIIGERPHEIKLKDHNSVWINDFDMVYSNGRKDFDIYAVKDIFQEAFTKIWSNAAEDDGFNRLVLEAQLTWQEIAMLRAYTKYLRQTGFTFSQNYIEQAFINNAHIAKDLVALFKLRFSPANSLEQRETVKDIIIKIEQAFDAVSSLDEDRILRRILEVILATLRTNYFQTYADGSAKPYISFKFNPHAISELPLPRPKYEIFVYSPEVEGIHLRAGKVARGGIRWSDRREDFRTEVLGLMKAQQVKNAVIVPVGAKGGFVVKQPLTDGNRDAVMKKVIDCYSTFMRGILDITDNIIDNQIIPPINVVRYDEDDPYMVVAADKGTATFSDIANTISQEYGFWLGDAFASGGSSGYDHKKMGITSRGVWESVKRHFLEININPEQDDFTVVGIGDMAGDVFGNGMLLSRHIKLVGAFNHQHIFLDPDPDPQASYEERKRLFNLPRSSWTDYNATMISTGGGIYNRSAKSIPLSPEIKKILNVDKDSLVPNELIRAILKAPVTLIWNGGIGTFVKSTQESHADAGDRTNDSIRVDGNEVTARVIAEGGNLGFTQLARIEYSLNGGIIYTDFIDNSAGVNCSDHEVNIKILLNKLVTNGQMKLPQRDKLLEQMTDEIAELVLYDNYEQTQMLGLEASVSQQTMDLFRRYMSDLEAQGQLDRKLESLPDDKTLQERKASHKPLTRPEIAMLLAYCKMYLKQDILASNIPDDSYFIRYLLTGFPKPLRENYLEEIKQHSLRREIIATQLSKYVTDRMGINFVERLTRETGASVAFVVRAFVVAEGIYQMEEAWQQVESLDKTISPATQSKLMLQIYYLIRRTARWFLRNRKPNIDIQQTILDFSQSIVVLTENLDQLLTEPDKNILNKEVATLISQGVPEALAKKVAATNVLFTSLDIVEATKKHHLVLTEVAKTYYLLGNRLELNWLRDSMNNYEIETQWDELARAGFRDDLDRVQRKLSVMVLKLKTKDISEKSIEERIDFWMKQYNFLMERWQSLIADIKATETFSFVTYSVILRELFDFAQAA
ncbi:MAG: NAD-glutamate dehydrogenase [Gammaproteobacteria bacterium RIFCSPHIGHO2_12_FULL_42_13]|nr:MAG: NAD-glutamate dehydrogenase [Gammaproteobacteria bacterium RIFCSPHIGHO2_12_FULL_42_13]